jgi:glycosyltransferase involved in cell wall biosynthesis
MSATMHVLLLTETFSPEIGGGERQAALLSGALIRRGHQVTIVTRRSRRALPPHERLDGVDVRRIGPAGGGRWKKWGLALTTAPAMLRAAGRTDVVLVSGFRIMGIPAAALSRLLRLPVVLKADSTGEMSGSFFTAGLASLGLTPRSLSVRAALSLRNAILRRAAAFAAMSREIGDELATAGVSRDRIHYIPNGVDTDRFSPVHPERRAVLRTRLGLPRGRIAVYTGRLVSYKGLPLLVSVWDEMVRSGMDGTLVLVGAAGGDMHACEDDLRAFVRERSLEERVYFAGGVDNVHEYLQAADAFVFPTLNEAFGVSLIEAMACGLPCVATRVGGIPDFVVDGSNGLLVQPGDRGQLHAALERVLAGGADVEALGQRARATVLSSLSAEAVASAYIALFHELSVTRRAARTMTTIVR